MGRRHPRDEGDPRRRAGRPTRPTRPSARRAGRGGGAATDAQLVREHWRADGAPKTPFPSADEAARASLQARLEHGTDVDPYHCSVCGAWHLGRRR